LNDVRRKHALFWGIVVAWVTTDILTKACAVARLSPGPHRVVGDLVRFTLVYNRGAAFGMHVGEWSRWVFTVLTLGALVMLAHLFRETRPGDTPRTLALSLVTAGAIGNLIDRILSSRGVVDFIDIGVPSWRFWTFNVADIGVSCGAVLLAFVLWREERAQHAVAASGSTQAPAS
jgi:signal peptidase II